MYIHMYGLGLEEVLPLRVWVKMARHLHVEEVHVHVSWSVGLKHARGVEVSAGGETNSCKLQHA